MALGATFYEYFLCDSERGTWGDEQLAVAWQLLLQVVGPEDTRCLTRTSRSSPVEESRVSIVTTGMEPSLYSEYCSKNAARQPKRSLDTRFLAPFTENRRAENVSIYYTCVQFIIEHITISSLCRHSMTTGPLFMVFSTTLDFDVK